MVQVATVQDAQPQVHHHGSHESLLSPAGPVLTRPGMDAIIVPTARHPANLTEAAFLAKTLDCPMVTLHSGARTAASMAAARVAARNFPEDLDLIAIDLPASLRMPRWETWALVTSYGFERPMDISTKRNLGLMLSHLLGWSRVLFLDDDLTGLNPDDVRDASGLLASNNAVGLEVDGYRDNSVVCHAYRQSGGRQRSFVGGGALAVDLNRCNSFFPDIYNDDWFFLLDGDKRLQPTAVTGRVYQFPYDPFITPARARYEEFGDVLAEGVFWLLDQDLSITDADHDHWERFLTTRREFIDDVITLVKTDNLTAYEKWRRIAALDGSLGRLNEITPDICARYLDAWRSDLRRWAQFRTIQPTGVARSAIRTALEEAEFPGLTVHHSIGEVLTAE